MAEDLRANELLQGQMLTLGLGDVSVLTPQPWVSSPSCHQTSEANLLLVELFGCHIPARKTQLISQKAQGLSCRCGFPSAGILAWAILLCLLQYYFF